MRIEYRLDDLAFESTDLAGLESCLRDFLAGLKVEASVVREDDKVAVDYPEFDDIDAKEDEQVVVNFCKGGRFGKAKKVAKELIAKVPWSSNAHRLLAQTLMEERETEAAIDETVVALKLDPHSLSALTILGNLYAQGKGDVGTALKYYRRAYDLYPETALAVSNYASALLGAKQDVAQQEKLFRKAIELQPDYLNTYYGLATVLGERGDFQGAFAVAQTGLLRGRERPENTAPVRDALTALMLSAARNAAKEPLDGLIDRKREEVEHACGTKVVIEKDASVSNLVVTELAEQYRRDYHRLVLGADSDKPGAQYCILHEMEKMLMRFEANKRVGACNLVTVPSARAIFREKTMAYVTPKLRENITGDIEGFLDRMLQGVCLQLLNCPLDFFAFRRLYEQCPEARAHQLAAVYVMATQAIEGARTGKTYGLPRNVVRINRTLSAVSFLQYRDLMGLDLLADLEPEEDELKAAMQLYESCVTFADAYAAGDEWILVSRFIRDLNCSSFCAVIGLKDDPVEGRTSQATSRASSTACCRESACSS